MTVLARWRLGRCACVCAMIYASGCAAVRASGAESGGSTSGGLADVLSQMRALFAQPEARRLRPGEPLQGVIRPGETQWMSFRVQVPQSAIAMEIAVSQSPADLDLYIRHGAPIADYEAEADFSVVTERFNERFRLSRWDETGLASGTYYVDVVYAYDLPPLVGKRRLEEIPFQLDLTFVRPKVQGQLAPGQAVSGATSPEVGHVCSYEVDVPPDAPCLRVDLSDVGADLDIFVTENGPIRDLAAASHRVEGLAGRETLIIDSESDPPLQPGRYYVNVIDRYVSEQSVPFQAHVTFGAAPPEGLLDLPQWPTGESPLEHAVHATVELIGHAGGGSGVLVTPDGLILTNYHVVEDSTGLLAAPGEVIVAVTRDATRPPVESFRARVLEAEKGLDLALVEVTSGYYGQPLPAGYRFPHLRLGREADLSLGDGLLVLGYPALGGTGSRASITLTRGILSGFELHPEGVMLKTDAEIHSGNSGGAAMNQAFELVGVPSEIVQAVPGEGSGQLGFLRSVSLLPEAWRAMIEARTGVQPETTEGRRELEETELGESLREQEGTEAAERTGEGYD